jgi:hypothetical protein
MMKSNSLLSFIAGFLFLVAAVLSFINGSLFRGVISLIAAISFILAGIHWRRKGLKR